MSNKLLTSLMNIDGTCYIEEGGREGEEGGRKGKEEGREKRRKKERGRREKGKRERKIRMRDEKQVTFKIIIKMQEDR